MGNGQDGAVRFVVNDGETPLKYNRIFNLNLLKFKLKTESSSRDAEFSFCP